MTRQSIARQSPLKMLFAGAAFAVLPLAACSSGPTPEERRAAALEEKGETLEDAALSAKVGSAILEDKSLEGAEIHVETYNNVVRLHGFVLSQKDAERAEMIALGVQGVRRVKNDLYVR
jgi:hyperosmotically inducible protein